MTDKSITELLADFGVTHTRDAKSSTDGAHDLFIGGTPIGRYDAGQAAKLLTALREFMKARAYRRPPEELGGMDW